MTENPDWLGLKSIIEQAGHALEIEWEHLTGVPELSQIPQELHPFVLSEDVAADGGAPQVGAALEAADHDGNEHDGNEHEGTEHEGTEGNGNG